MQQRYEVRIMWRRKGQRKVRIIRADSIEQAKRIAFEKFGVHRGVRLAKQQQ